MHTTAPELLAAARAEAASMPLDTIDPASLPSATCTPGRSWGSPKRRRILKRWFSPATLQRCSVSASIRWLRMHQPGKASSSTRR